MRASEVTLEWLQEHVEGWESAGEGQYYCWCPVHDDVGTPVKGGSITVKPNGKILYKCHSEHCGATLTDVIKAIEGGYDASEDEDVPRIKVRKNASAKGKTGLAAWENYTQVDAHIWEMLGCFDHGGTGVKFVFDESDVIKVRKFPKEIHFEPKGAVLSPFWPIPHDELPEHISITEGESDCGTTYAAGLPAGFSVTKGSDTPLSVEAFQALASRGVRQITIYSDTDASGIGLREKITSLAIDAGIAVNICDLNRVVDPFYPHKDLNSLWKAIDDVEMFKDLIARATYAVARGREFLTYDEVLVEARKEMDWLIDHLLAPQDKVLLWGPPKAYKTWIVLDFIRSVTMCKPFLMRDEWTPKHPLRVWLIEEEGNITLFTRRLERLQLETDMFMLTHRKGIKFTDPESMAYVISVCREYEVDIVIFDPLQRMIPGVNENDAAETGIVWDEIARLQEACPQLSVMVVHHGNKGETGGWGSSRGSSRHGGEVDLGIAVQKHQVEDNVVSIWMDGRETHANLEPDASFKGKISITEDKFEIDARDVELKVRKTKRDQEADQNIHDVFMAIKGGCETRTQIKKQVNLSDNTVIKHLAKLVEDGMITEVDNGKGVPKTYKEVESGL